MNNPNIFYNPNTESLESLFNVIHECDSLNFSTLGEYAKIINDNLSNCVPTPVCDHGDDERHRWLIVEPRGIEFCRSNNGKFIYKQVDKNIRLKWLSSSTLIEHKNVITPMSDNDLHKINMIRVLMWCHNNVHTILPLSYMNFSDFDLQPRSIFTHIFM